MNYAEQLFQALKPNNMAEQMANLRRIAEKAAVESRLEDNLVAMDAALTRAEQQVGNAIVRKKIEAHKQGGSE